MCHLMLKYFIDSEIFRTVLKLEVLLNHNKLSHPYPLLLVRQQAMHYFRIL